MSGITTAICTSFKGELLKKLHNLDAGGDTFNFALFTGAPVGTFGSATTNYANMGADELPTGGGYTRPGKPTTNGGITTPGLVARADFGNVQWTGATFNTSGVLMYNTSSANRAVAVWSFGGAQSLSAATFLLQMPAASDATSLIRVA